MDLFAARLVDHDVGEEGDELGRSVPLGGLAEHLAGLGVEGRIERQGAVAVVLKAMAFGAARGERQDRVLAIQGLNVRLLIDAEHRRVRRRVQIQPNDVGRLLLKVRIVRGHVALDPMRLESVLAPHTRHHHVADVQMGRRACASSSESSCSARGACSPESALPAPGSAPSPPGRYAGCRVPRSAAPRIACSSWPQSLGCTRCARRLHPTYGRRPAARSAALVGHLPLDPCGCWLAGSVPYAPRSSR